MKYEAISFDAAGTLIDVQWDPVVTVLTASHLAGIDLPDQQVAGEIYGRMLQTRWPHFQQLNLQRSRQVCDEFWRQLGEDWMRRLELPIEKLPALVEAADHYLFGSGSTVFTLFPDTLATLQGLKQHGVPLVILSNWDVSLHRTCDILDITPFFTEIIASLEEGVEKPDPGLFAIAGARIGTKHVLHIGDDPVADIKGARDFGWDALHIDRAAPSSNNKISSLSEIEGYL